MKRFALFMIFALGFAGPVLALQQPAPGQRDARVRTVTYDPANVVRVNGVIRASTQILFADDQEVAHVAIGDSVRCMGGRTGRFDPVPEAAGKASADQFAGCDHPSRRPQVRLMARRSLIDEPHGIAPTPDV